MSINTVLYSGTSKDSDSWKQLGLKSLHTEDLVINGKSLIFDKFDSTIPVNTYDGANNLVTSDVFSLNIHAINVGHIVVMTIAQIGYTAPGAFNYFGFQLPSADFIPNTINSSVLLCSVGGTFATNKYTITTTGQVRIFKDLNASNFALGDVFAAPQQTITYDNTN